MADSGNGGQQHLRATAIHSRDSQLVKAPSPSLDCSLKWEVGVKCLLHVAGHKVPSVPWVEGRLAFCRVQAGASAKKNPVRPLEQGVENLGGRE